MLKTGYVAKSFTTAELSYTQLDELVMYVEALFTWFAPGSTAEVIKQRLCQHPNAKVTVIFFEGVPCAFGVYYCQFFNNAKVLYRGGTVIDEAHRSHGLYRYLIESSLEEEKPDIIVTRTQNPRVYESLQHETNVLYPQLNCEDAPEMVYKIALEFSHSGIVEPNLRVREVYSDLRKEKSFRFAKDHRLNNFFNDQLGEIDAFMVVGFV